MKIVKQTIEFEFRVFEIGDIVTDDYGSCLPEGKHEVIAVIPPDPYNYGYSSYGMIKIEGHADFFDSCGVALVRDRKSGE